MKTKLRGVFVPNVTPFLLNGEIDENGLRSLVCFYQDSGCNGVVPCGSTGEAPLLNQEERRKVIKTVIDEVSSGMLVIAGTGTLSTDETIKLSRDAADLGADAALIITPYFYKLSEEEIKDHYAHILGKIDLPVIIYNVPKFTGFNLKPELVAEIVDQYSQVIGVKDSSGSIGQISKLIELAGRKISVLAGTGDTFLPTLAMGGEGGVLAIANVVPKLCVEIFKKYKQGKLEEAREIQHKVTVLNDFLVKKHNQISCLKEALNQLNKPGGHPRKPINPPTTKVKQEISRLLKTFSSP